MSTIDMAILQPLMTCVHAALDKEVMRVREEGGVPFFVGATAGTTVLGAFDPLDSIAEVGTTYRLAP